MITSRYTPISEKLREDRYTKYSGFKLDQFMQLADLLGEKHQKLMKLLSSISDESPDGNIGLLGYIALPNDKKIVIDQIPLIQDELINIQVRLNQMAKLPFDQNVPWQWLVPFEFHKIFSDGMSYQKNKSLDITEARRRGKSWRLRCLIFMHEKWSKNPEISKSEMYSIVKSELDPPYSTDSLKDWISEATDVNAIDVPEATQKKGRRKNK